MHCALADGFVWPNNMRLNPLNPVLTDRALIGLTFAGKSTIKEAPAVIDGFAARMDASKWTHGGLDQARIVVIQRCGPLLFKCQCKCGYGNATMDADMHYRQIRVTLIRLDLLTPSGILKSVTGEQFSEFRRQSGHDHWCYESCRCSKMRQVIIR